MNDDEDYLDEGPTGDSIDALIELLGLQQGLLTAVATGGIVGGRGHERPTRGWPGWILRFASDEITAVECVIGRPLGIHVAGSTGDSSDVAAGVIGIRRGDDRRRRAAPVV
jgi:hypothetical protein